MAVIGIDRRTQTAGTATRSALFVAMGFGAVIAIGTRRTFRARLTLLCDAIIPLFTLTTRFADFAIIAGLTIFAGFTGRAIFAWATVIARAIVAARAGIALVTAIGITATIAAVAVIFTAVAIVIALRIAVGPIHVKAAVEILDALNLTFTALPALLALRPVFFLTGTEIGQNPEIMVRELQIIFGLHPVAGQLGIARQILELFNHLRRIAARAVVDAIAAVVTAAIATLRPIATTTIVIVATATATALPDVHADPLFRQ